MDFHQNPTMKKIRLLLAAICLGLTAQAQSWQTALSEKKATITVHYLDNFPFAYTDDAGTLTGIEIDIMEEFGRWLKKNKGIEKVQLVYLPAKEFNAVYTQTQNGQGAVVGLASVTVTKAREQEVNFSPPYLKNISLLISNTELPSLRAYDDIPRTFAGMVAVVNNGTILEQQLMDIKKKHHPKMRVEYVDHPAEVVEKVAQTKSAYYGYVDLLTYWAYLKKQPANLKIHRIATIDSQRLAFMLPKNSDWQQAFNEFFESGFGYTATAAYAKILEKHLGYEVVKSVELY